jgi:hypothetical protein
VYTKNPSCLPRSDVTNSRILIHADCIVTHTYHRWKGADLKTKTRRMRSHTHTIGQTKKRGGQTTKKKGGKGQTVNTHSCNLPTSKRDMTGGGGLGGGGGGGGKGRPGSPGQTHCRWADVPLSEDTCPDLICIHVCSCVRVCVCTMRHAQDDTCPDRT